MKSVKLFRLLVLSGLISFGVACSDDDEDDVQPANNNNNNNESGVTISEQIAATAELDSLEVALAHIGLNSTLESAGNYTVFAPSNQAFQALLQEHSVQRVSHIPDTTLMDLLQYHISSQAEYMAADLSGQMYIESMNSSGPDNSQLSIQVNGSGSNVVLNGEATITDADIDASNGVLHVIDNYIDKPTILTFLEVDGRFDSLLVIVKDNNYNYENAFSSGMKTLFAPSNQACAAYISASPYAKMDDIPLATKPTILNYHYTNNVNLRSDQMSQDQEITSVQGNKLIIDLTNGIELETVSSSQGNVNVSVTDIQATNGVLHIVDEVLLPF